MKEKFIQFLYKYKKRLVVVCILCFIILSGIYVYQTKQTTTFLISLNYEEANKGLNPNHTKFNIFDIKSEEVLNRTLELSGLSDEYTIDELSNDISISLTSTTSSIVPTTYQIVYNKHYKNLHMSSEQITKFLFDAYEEYFRNNYSSNNNILTYEIQDFTDDDYLSIISNLELNAKRISNYLNDRLKENNTFRDTNQYSFEDLKKNIDNIIEINISNLSAYVKENGLTKNETSAKKLLTYKNELLDIDYQKMILGYETRKEGIGLYDSNMSSFVLIPSIDEYNDYYMSKTKIGIDYLAKDANYYLEESEWFKSEISKNKQIETNIGFDNSNEKQEKANEMIVNIQQLLNDTSKQAKKFDQEYIEYKNKDYMSCRIEPNSISKKKLLLVGMCSVGISIIINLGLCLRKRKRNVKDTPIC